MVLQSLDSEQRAFPLATGITVINKGWLKDWHQPVVKQMMNDAVTEGCGEDLSKHRVSDYETHTTTDTVTPRYDIIIQFH